MQNSINLKDLVIGTAIGVILMLTIAAGSSQTSNNFGRYQLALGDGWIFKIDTTTGQVWKAIPANPPAAFMAGNGEK